MADERYEDDEPEMTYVIPVNFSTGTKVFGLQLRNVIEAVIVCAPIAFFEYNLLINTSMTTLLVVMLATVGPLLIVSAIGINGDSISQFIFSVFRFLKNKRIMRYQRIKKYSDTNKSKIKAMPKNKR